MSSWEYELAGQFKSRDNPKTKMGPMLGKIVSTSPAVVTIQDGKYTISGVKCLASQILDKPIWFLSLKSN